MKEFDTPVMPIRNRIAIFSVEYGIVEREGSALVVTDINGVRAQLPVGATAVLMLEPGTTITHAAVQLCAEARTLIIWVGEGGVRLYSAGQEGAAHSYRLLRQARLALNDSTRLGVAREMYRIRFGEEAPKRRSIQQLRGMEGARVRLRYQELSQQYNVPWQGRRYDRTDWSDQDEINRAISSANSCLYGLCHAAILIGGYSAAIGFIHTGYPLAFVHDVADIWKMDICVETAFQVVADGEGDVARRVRHRLRDQFREKGILDDIIPQINRLLDAAEPNGQPPNELGGAHEETTDAWEFAWYRPGGSRYTPEESQTAESTSTSVHSSSSATGSVTGERQNETNANYDQTVTGNVVKEQWDKGKEKATEQENSKDDGEDWANEVFGAWEDPWKKKENEERSSDREEAS